jgi:hypothetical protein
MMRGKILAVIGFVAVLALVVTAQPGERREDGPPPMMVMAVPPQPPVGSGPMPALALREYAEQLRMRARHAQELADLLRRQADEVDQMAKRPMDRGPGPQLQRQYQPMRPEQGMEVRQEMKKQVERLRDEARKAKEQGRFDQSEQMWKQADRLEQILREQGSPDAQRQAIKEKIERLRDESRMAKEQNRMADAERQWKEADRLEQQLRGQGSPEGERPQIKQKIERLRDEARMAKEQNRREDAERLGNEANRLEQQLREQGPRGQGEPGKQGPPEVQDILRAAEQAEREGRMEDARRQREKAEAVMRQFQEQNKPGLRQMAPQLRDELMRSMDGIKAEIGRLWQAVNEIRSRSQGG